MNDDEGSFEVEPEALRAAELLQAEQRLRQLVGRRISGIRVEETRIGIEVDGGTIAYFYGFMGEVTPDRS